MSIHFYKKGEKVKSLFELTDNAYNLLEKSIEKFESKTGIFIDPYGTTTLYPQNIKLLIEIIEQDFLQIHGKRVSAVEIVINQLQLLYQLDILVEAVGD